MQVYKTFFKIAKKYLVSSIIYFVVFAVLMYIMSQLGEEQTTSRFVAKSIRFTVVDEDHSEASEALVDYLSSKHELVEFDHYDEEFLQDNLYYEWIEYVLFIPAGYEEKILAGETENLVTHAMRTDSARGYFFNQDVDAYFSSLSLYITGGYETSEALALTKAACEKANQAEVTVKQFEKTTNNENKTIFYFFQYFAYVSISILLLAMAPILISFHKKDLAERLYCSSTSKRKQSIGLGLGCITYAVGLWFILMVYGTIAYGPSHMLSPEGILGLFNSFIYVVVITMLTLLLGSFDLEANSLNMIANIISLGASFLCGIFVPIWYMADSVIAMARFLPTYWYIINNNMISGFSGEAISMARYWQNIGVQLIFAVAIGCVYLVVNRQKRKAVLV